MVKDLTYLSYPLPEDVERLVYSGDLSRARRVIDRRLADPKVPECLKERLRFELRILDEIPRTYTVPEQALLTRLSDAIEGFTREEMESMRDEGTLDWVLIDGAVFFKDNAFENAIKSRPALHSRLKDPALLSDSNENTRMLNEVIAKMKRDGHAHYRYHLRTTLSIAEHAQRPGQRIRVHLPLPLRDGQCTPGSAIVTSPAAKHIAAETEPQRTAYFEEIYQPGMTFTADFTYDIDAPYVDPDPAKVSPEQPAFDTEEMLPHIRFTPFIRALCAELKGDETNPLLIARRFYDYCTTNAVYRYVPPYFMKTNIPEYFAAGQRGDCGMHAITFITLCRCAGIPAQWQAGLYTRPGDIGNHDWARFYVAPYGWLYCDGSFGGSAYRAGCKERHDFYFTNLDPFRMVANRDFQQEFDPPKAFLRADPYDSQSGEVEYDDCGLTSHDFDIHREMLSWEIIKD